MSAAIEICRRLDFTGIWVVCLTVCLLCYGSFPLLGLFWSGCVDLDIQELPFKRFHSTFSAEIFTHYNRDTSTCHWNISSDSFQRLVAIVASGFTSHWCHIAIHVGVKGTKKLTRENNYTPKRFSSLLFNNQRIIIILNWGRKMG